MEKTKTIVDTDVIPATTETPSDDNIINCNTSTSIKEKILSAIDHIKNVRHKRADTDSIFEFISKNSPDVDKCIVISTLFDLLAENTITNKKCSNGLDSYKRIKETVDSVTTEDEQQVVVATELSRSIYPVNYSPRHNLILTLLKSLTVSLSLKILTKNALFKLTTK